MEEQYIKKVEIKGLWQRKDIIWDNVNPDVNILVGINGSGKTSVINLIEAAFNTNFHYPRKYKIESLDLLFTNKNTIEYCRDEDEDNTKDEDDGNDFFSSSSSKNSKGIFLTLISTFDVPAKGETDKSPLTDELLDTIYTTGSNKKQNSFFNYRLKASNFPEQANEINNNIRSLYSLIDKQFEKTGKKITIDLETNNVIFKNGEDIIQIEDLSSGEKQFLLIIFKVFLMEKQPAILLMDEPEISLHIDWQYELINVIRELNPNCQVIISTHSPSIFGDGWGDKVVYLDDITKDRTKSENVK